MSIVVYCYIAIIRRIISHEETKWNIKEDEKICRENFDIRRSNPYEAKSSGSVVTPCEYNLESRRQSNYTNDWIYAMLYLYFMFFASVLSFIFV